MSLSEEHALVFGASGLIGWAVVDELLSSHPPDGISHRVTAVTNRPITAESCSWHVSSSTSARLNIVSGVDLSTNKKDDLLELLKRRIPDVETVTHLYYFGMCVRVVEKLVFAANLLQCSSLIQMIHGRRR